LGKGSLGGGALGDEDLGEEGAESGGGLLTDSAKDLKFMWSWGGKKRRI